ncbi:MAG: SUMF1/EgtB/PvdO family nonheme iron enzyme [Planctomycetes bacterium]|nr:SUMF1/EgtB/PvdO family nonheme iron enzyme [Planctomycetota bacterium]
MSSHDPNAPEPTGTWAGPTHPPVPMPIEPAVGDTLSDHRSEPAPADTVSQVSPPAPVANTGTLAAPDGPPSLDGTLPEDAGNAAKLSQEVAARPTPTVPGYQLLGELGRGGMGVVYRARQIRLNRPTALKMLLGGQFSDTVAQVRFLVEAEVIAQIQHLNVVQVFEFGQADGQPFFALEFVDGGTLGGKLQSVGRFAPRAAAVMVAKLADGIAAAHAKGIVHRDMKPANVLIDEHGEPKVTDFGLAKVGTSDMTASGAIMGTPSYMSPEQAAGKTKDVGTTTDIYALGVILYELLAGKVPFKGDSIMETIQHVISREPVRPRAILSSIPRDLETICLKCLEKDSKKRYATAEALAADLRAYLDGRPITARPVGSLERTWKWVKRNPGRAAVAAASVLVLIGAGIAANEVQKQQTRDQVAAERKLGEERLAAEEKRAADLKAADDQARQKQRETRADSLVRGLGTAATAGVPRVIEDLAEVHELARPKLVELAAEPVTTKTGLHARLALLVDEPGRAAELAAYLPTCQPDELLTIRQLLKPHAASVAPALWSVLTDARADVGKRVRVASALAGLTPDDPRWVTVAPAVTDAAVRATAGEFVVWSQALDPIRKKLTPTLAKRYPESRSRIEAGKLAVSDLVAEVTAFEFTANLLARFTADQPAELAELAVTVDGRHHAQFAEAIKGMNRDTVVPLLKAELAKAVTPDWKDSPLKAEWKPVDAATLKAIEGAEGMVQERFVFVQAIPLVEFEPLANSLALSGYRPVRVRPCVAEGRVMVAALWKRDGIGFKFASSLTAAEVLAKDVEMRATGFQPADVAAWVDPEAKPQPDEPLATVLGGAAGWSAANEPAFQFTVVWEPIADGKAASRLYVAGAGTAGHRLGFTAYQKANLKAKTVQSVGVLGVGTWFSGVWGDVPGSSWLSWFNTATSYLAGRPDEVGVDITFSPDSLGAMKYAAVWHGGFSVDVEQSLGMTVEEHVQKSRDLAVAGWRIVALDVSGSGKAASIWHRPVMQDAAIETLSKRQANAAAVLLTLGESESVWPLFAFPKNGDPSVRSYLLERLAAIGADPKTLMQRFEAETNVSAKRALLIALGDFPLELVPANERELLASRLLVQYRNHPDSGLHSAIDWLLRQKWGKAKELTAIDAELAAEARGRVLARVVVGSSPVPVFAGVPGAAMGPLLPAPSVATGKDWYVNGEGQTYAVVRGPVEFTLGSPLTEPGRLTSEAAHHKRISRTFAIGTKEVTVEQYLRFRPNHSWTKRYSPDPDSPIVSVTWYDCAEYCNWLSEREGIPRDQWCYEPNKDGKYAEGMSMKLGHLSLTGYRLPTEPEWEYACRSGGVTPRYYGRGEGLLPRYGWFAKTADDRAWPVGQLRPNDRGLFDALGNAMEWIEAPAFNYTTTQREDIEDAKHLTINEQSDRILRGGSFILQPVILRSANRNVTRPGNRSNSSGFRPSRTLLD